MFLDKLNDNLPKWDLTDLYSGVKSEQLTNDISMILSPLLMPAALSPLARDSTA